MSGEEELRLIPVFGAVLGGIALLLYGMKLMTQTLSKIAGFSEMLSRWTSTTLSGLMAGFLVTILVNSSNVVVMLTAQFAVAGILNVSQTLPILLGAGVGTSMSSQFLALNLTEYSLYFVGIGYILAYCTGGGSNSNRRPEALQILTRRTVTGTVLLGLGFSLLGVQLTSAGLTPLKHSPSFISAMSSLDSQYLSVLAGTLATTLLQSSTATIGICIALAQSDSSLMTPLAAAGLVLGANVGSAIAPLLLLFRSSKEGRRVGWLNLWPKLLGTAVVMLFLPLFVALVQAISPEGEKGMGKVIANMHTVFNVLLVVAFIPFNKLFVRAVTSQVSA